MHPLQSSSIPATSGITSILETLDIQTGERTVLAEFGRLIEAPNWTRDNKLIYNSDGLIYAYDITASTSQVIDSGYVNHCNNDHVLSPDHSQLAVSHHTKEDGKSRIYIFFADRRRTGSDYSHGAQLPSWLVA